MQFIHLPNNNIVTNTNYFNTSVDIGLSNLSSVPFVLNNVRKFGRFECSSICHFSCTYQTSVLLSI